MIVELEDINDMLTHEEIAKRPPVEKEEDKKKFIRAYVIDPDNADDIETKRAEAVRHEVPFLDDRDEVIYLKKLHHNREKQEVLFAIMLQSQHSINLCRVKFSEIEKGKVTESKDTDGKVT